MKNKNIVLLLALLVSHTALPLTPTQNSAIEQLSYKIKNNQIKTQDIISELQTVTKGLSAADKKRPSVIELDKVATEALNKAEYTVDGAPIDSVLTALTSVGKVGITKAEPVIVGTQTIEEPKVGVTQVAPITAEEKLVVEPKVGVTEVAAVTQKAKTISMEQQKREEAAIQAIDAFMQKMPGMLPTEVKQSFKAEVRPLLDENQNLPAQTLFEINEVMNYIEMTTSDLKQAEEYKQSQVAAIQELFKNLMPSGFTAFMNQDVAIMQYLKSRQSSYAQASGMYNALNKYIVDMIQGYAQFVDDAIGQLHKNPSSFTADWLPAIKHALALDAQPSATRLKDLVSLEALDEYKSLKATVRAKMAQEEYADKELALALEEAKKDAKKELETLIVNDAYKTLPLDEIQGKWTDILAWEDDLDDVSKAHIKKIQDYLTKLHKGQSLLADVQKNIKDLRAMIKEKGDPVIIKSTLNILKYETKDILDDYRGYPAIVKQAQEMLSDIKALKGDLQNMLEGEIDALLKDTQEMKATFETLSEEKEVALTKAPEESVKEVEAITVKAKKLAEEIKDNARKAVPVMEALSELNPSQQVQKDMQSLEDVGEAIFKQLREEILEDVSMFMIELDSIIAEDKQQKD